MTVTVIFLGVKMTGASQLKCWQDLLSMFRADI